jgi:hypothetical protein
MESKKKPLWLVFRKVAPSTHSLMTASVLSLPASAATVIDSTIEEVAVMFKCGDDLRQDQLTLQVDYGDASNTVVVALYETQRCAWPVLDLRYCASWMNCGKAKAYA